MCQKNSFDWRTAAKLKDERLQNCRCLKSFQQVRRKTGKNKQLKKHRTFILLLKQLFCYIVYLWTLSQTENTHDFAKLYGKKTGGLKRNCTMNEKGFVHGF